MENLHEMTAPARAVMRHLDKIMGPTSKLLDKHQRQLDKIMGPAMKHFGPSMKLADSVNALKIADSFGKSMKHFGSSMKLADSIGKSPLKGIIDEKCLASLTRNVLPPSMKLDAFTQPVVGPDRSLSSLVGLAASPAPEPLSLRVHLELRCLVCHEVVQGVCESKGMEEDVMRLAVTVSPVCLSCLAQTQGDPRKWSSLLDDVIKRRRTRLTPIEGGASGDGKPCGSLRIVRADGVDPKG